MIQATGELDSGIPSGPVAEKWDRHRFDLKLVNPANKRKYTIIVVGTGLAGASAAASLAELGYNVLSFCLQDSPRRAHSIAAQGGINAAKNYPNDGDSVWRLFYDTVKGGDFRSREANVYRLAQISNLIIDHCVALGVPFAREYGGTLANRSFGGAQVSRTFYARGQTGQQLLLGAYGAMLRQVAAGKVKLMPRREMLDLVVVDGVRPRHRHARSRHREIRAVRRRRRRALHGRLRQRLLPLDQRQELQRDGLLAVPQAGGVFRQSLLHADSSDLHSGQRRAPVEADADERELAERRPRLGAQAATRSAAAATRFPTPIGTISSNGAIRPSATWCRATSPRGPSRNGATRASASARRATRSISISATPSPATALRRSARSTATCSRCTTRSRPRIPTRRRCGFIRPSTTRWAGLWVDYDLESTIPGLFVLGEANFSDHGANRLGASALMQGLADGYFIIPYTMGQHLATRKLPKVSTDHPAFAQALADAKGRIDKIASIQGHRTVDSIHRDLGRAMWERCGMSRDEAGLKTTIERIRELRDEFWRDVKVPGTGESFNQNLEHAGRVADFLEFAELLATDALNRKESCGGHFREEYQTPDGEAQRDDENFCHVGAWEFQGVDKPEVLHKEPLHFEAIPLAQRSYK